VITVGALIGLLCLAGVGLLLYIGMPYTLYEPDRCQCGLVDLTDRSVYAHESMVHSRGLCQPPTEWISA
jgi:hypothetical protein